MDNFSVEQDYSAISDDYSIGDITIDLNNSSSYAGSDTIVFDTSTITLTGAGAAGSSGAGNVIIGGGGAGASYAYTSGGTVGITAQPIDTITIGNINTFTWETPTEWVDGFPEWDRIQDMCKEYPGLKIAFDKFKTTYNLVKDDFDTPPEKRFKP